MQGRTIILVSHHVQLCMPGASYVVALDNGRLQFEGSRDAFKSSGVMRTLVHSTHAASRNGEDQVAEVLEEKAKADQASESSSTLPSFSEVRAEKKPPRTLVEEEKRAVGRVGRDIWMSYIWACGKGGYWATFIAVLVAASISPVIENSWLR